MAQSDSSSKTVGSGNVNPDLVRERQKATFDPEQLALILYGDILAKRRRLGQSLNCSLIN
jgi:hypothetical protein